MQPHLSSTESAHPEAAFSAHPPVATAQPEAAQARELQLLQQAAVKFESFFVAQMMQQMRKATAALADADSPLNVEAHQAPLAMADHAVADSLASTGAFGIANVLVRQMAAPLVMSSASLNSTIPVVDNTPPRSAT